MVNTDKAKPKKGVRCQIEYLARWPINIQKCYLKEKLLKTTGRKVSMRSKRKK